MVRNQERSGHSVWSHAHGCGFVLGPARASGVSRDVLAPCEHLSKDELGWQQLQAEAAAFLRGTLKPGDSEELPGGVEGKVGGPERWELDLRARGPPSPQLHCLPLHPRPREGPLAVGTSAQAGVAGEFPSPAVLSPRSSMYSTAVRAPNWPGCRCHPADLLPPPPPSLSSSGASRVPPKAAPALGSLSGLLLGDSVQSRRG